MRDGAMGYELYGDVTNELCTYALRYGIKRHSLFQGCGRFGKLGISQGISIYLMMMMIGLNPGPRARTVKPGPRHLNTRPDPGLNRLGPHKGIPSGEARQCTPAGTEAVISALAPTAPPPIKAAQNLSIYNHIILYHHHRHQKAFRNYFPYLPQS